MARRSGHPHAPAGERGDARLRREDSVQIQGIGRGDPHAGAGIGAAELAEELDRLGERVLLAREALHEAPAAHLAPELPEAIDPHEIAPRDRQPLTLEDPPEDDAVAVEEPPRE